MIKHYPLELLRAPGYQGIEYNEKTEDVAIG